MTVYPRVCGGTSPEARVARVKTVYPRVCGGTAFPVCPLRAAGGLSPRVRGNLVDYQQLSAAGRSIPACAGDPGATRPGNVSTRSIPACAGEPPGRRPRRNSHWVYPRVCGEPAIRQPGQSIVKVYPRVCGGTVRRAFRSVLLKGLSPRVRGNQSGVTNRAAAIGSIPACAGEPTKSGAADYAARVYPRVCGGTSARRAKQDTSAGLSPRVRGNPLGTTAMTVGARSIPACAGEPISLGITTICESVYPRVCGGTAYHRRKSLKQQGLSPRVRGNRLRAKEVVGGVGSIPACAGEPFPIRRPPYAGMVYPRVCGGTVN